MRVRNIINKSLIAAAIAVVFTVSAMAQSSSTVVVTTANPSGWGFAQETATGSGSFVVGPDTPPLGIGSANLIVNSTGGEILGRAGYIGVQLSDMTKLEYSTYRAFGTPALAIALQFNIDYNTADAITGFQGRLVYEPYYTQTVFTGQWQDWNALNDAAGTATGNWWGTNAVVAAVCPQSNPCTWAEVNSNFPNAAVHPTFGAVILKAGGGWTGGFDGNVDALTIGVSSDDITYDFEPYAVATNKDQCKNGGWMTVFRADGSPFKNQGDCIQYVNTGR